MTPPAQIPLDVRLRDDPDLSNFVDGPNLQARRVVQGIIHGDGERLVYLWGPSGVGKSHLLKAAIGGRAALEQESSYIPLREVSSPTRFSLARTVSSGLVCLDDLGAVAGDRAWEEILFNIYNQLREDDRTLLVAARVPPAGLGLALPDLESRLTAMLVLPLAPLNDRERMEVLRDRARVRGLELPSEVAEYLLHRQRRDMHSLLGLLDCLDDASLAAKRRVTIPFIRELLE